MEDALISPEGFMILSGAGLVEASDDEVIYQHTSETVDAANVDTAATVSIDSTDVSAVSITISNEPYFGEKGYKVKYSKAVTVYTYAGATDSKPTDLTGYTAISDADGNDKYWYNGTKSTGTTSTTTEDSKSANTTTYSYDSTSSELTETITTYTKATSTTKEFIPTSENMAYVMLMKDGEIISEPYIPLHIEPKEDTDASGIGLGTYKIYLADHKAYDGETSTDTYSLATAIDDLDFDSVLVDYYIPRKSGAKQIEITADKFSGNYYLEASTLFRTQDGDDMPAEFIIPNCKIQSNFTFSMASSGDPSTFTFTIDAFPDYTRFDHSEKVMCAIQIIEDTGSNDIFRTQTVHKPEHDNLF